MYGGLGIFAAVPTIHLIILDLSDHEDKFTMLPSMIYYVSMGACYLGGLAIYATRCPEKYKPG
jgi:hypothetical protein